MKILVPVDSAISALSAAEKAMEIAGTGDSLVRLVAVVSNSEIRTLRRYIKMWQYADGSVHDKRYKIIDNETATYLKKQEAMQMLDSLAVKLCTPDGIRLEKSVIVGHHVQEIVSVAKNDDFDMIIVGVGSSRFNARGLSTKAPCPVLIVNDRVNIA